MGDRRNTELLLLLAAVPVLFLLFLTAILNSGEGISFSSFAVPLGLLVAFAVAHITIRRFAPNADPALLPITFLMSGIGICFVMRLAPDLAMRQVLWLFLSIVAMIVVLIFCKSIKSLTRYKYTLMLVGVVLMLLPAAIGMEQGGSKIWLSIAGISFQPSELAKILIVLSLAGYLSENREMLSITRHRVLGIGIPDFKTLLPLLLMWILAMLVVVFEHDLGSALFFFGVFVIMLYVTTGRKLYVGLGIGLLAIGAVVAYFGLGYVRARFDIWVDPFKDAQDSGYQLVQSLYSLADGGLFGCGLGRGLSTLIPVVESDFIFIAIAEEMGLLGATGVLMLYVLFAVRGFATAARCKSDVDAIASVGLTSSISFQAFVIVGGVIGVIPLTGVTLPFMSQGGSSLLSSFIILALLLRAGDQATGLETEMKGVTMLEGGILGRASLGKRLTVVITVFAILFALLIARLTYVMVIEAENIQTMPTNSHTILRESTSAKGSIITSDGVVLAESIEQEDGTYKRSYPQGSMASHLIGYSSERYGASGIEASQSELLSGNKGFGTWREAIRSLAGSETSGNDVVLTIDSTVQQVCEDVLANQVGGVVVMDAETGAILGSASSPTFDLKQAEVLLDAAQDENYEGSSLLNRTTDALYAPGSTFKVVTLVGALENGIATLESVFSGDSPMEIGGGIVTNYDGRSYGDITLREALAYSVNTAFGQLAVDLGAEELVGTAKLFGFGQDLGQDFTATASLMPEPSEMTRWETAWAGDGQPVGEHESPAGPQVTVTQMAVVAAAIANNGIAVNPYLVDRILDHSGAVVKVTSTKKIGAVDSEAVNAEVASAMEGVVQRGTGTEAAIAGVTVAGKTGTAETGKIYDDSWFMGYADDGIHKVAVAIVIEQCSSGTATPYARSVLQAALNALAA